MDIFHVWLLQMTKTYISGAESFMRVISVFLFTSSFASLATAAAAATFAAFSWSGLSEVKFMKFKYFTKICYNKS